MRTVQPSGGYTVERLWPNLGRPYGGCFMPYLGGARDGSEVRWMASRAGGSIGGPPGSPGVIYGSSGFVGE